MFAGQHPSEADGLWRDCRKPTTTLMSILMRSARPWTALPSSSSARSFPRTPSSVKSRLSTQSAHALALCLPGHGQVGPGIFCCHYASPLMLGDCWLSLERMHVCWWCYLPWHDMGWVLAAVAMHDWPSASAVVSHARHATCMRHPLHALHVVQLSARVLLCYHAHFDSAQILVVVSTTASPEA